MRVPKSNTLILITSFILLFVLLFFYHIFTVKNNKIKELSQEVLVLEADIISLEHIIENIKALREIEQQELAKVREEVGRLEAAKNTHIKRLEEFYRDENIVDSTLPDDVSRLLNEACAEIRGSACPNP